MHKHPLSLLGYLSLLLMTTFVVTTCSSDSQDSNGADDPQPTSRLMFLAPDNISPLDYELWKLESTGSLALVKDINPSGYSAMDGWSIRADKYPMLNGKLYFGANDGTNGRELWASDGTAAGTVMVKDINPAGEGWPAHITEFNGKLYFRANDGTNGLELWVSDGTADGTVMLKDIHPAGNSIPHQLTVFNGKLYFRADDGTNGSELWVSDGTAVGTVMLKDIHPAGDSYPSAFAELNGKLYFRADDGTNGSELWVSDGTAVGTVMFMDINSGAGNGALSYGYPYFEFNGKLYFAADNGTDGSELWVSDGTVGGTMMLKDVNSAGSSGPEFVGELGDYLYFTTRLMGHELWKTDGTEAGTVKVLQEGTGFIHELARD